MSRVAVALVTHQGERWLDAVLASIEGQRRQVDDIVVVDDRSTDGTRDILRAHGIAWVEAESTLRSATARTGQNFSQAVREAARRCPLVALADQDDTWHPNRIAHQAWCMDEQRHLAMFASDGTLVDEQGRPLGGEQPAHPHRTLRGAFPLPEGWYERTPADRLTAALGRSVATGGASMVRPERLGAALDVPKGWLHDRWWSLAALALDAFWADGEQVIDYRVSAAQQVGLDTGTQGHGALARLAGAVTGAPEALRRLGDVRGLREQAAPDVAPALTTPAILRGFAGR